MARCLSPSSPWNGESGCTPTSRTAGFRSFRYPPVPIMVPVVPIAATKWVTRPPVWAQISGPVVSRWAWGLAGLLYWSA